MNRLFRFSFHTFWLLLLMIGSGLSAQNAPCLTDEVMHLHQQEAPEYFERLQAENDMAYVKYLEEHREDGSRTNCKVYFVPVVVHVVHNGGASNISMTKIQSAITRTNEHLRSIDSHMEGFFRSNNIQDQQIAELLERVERLEKHQLLNDAQ